MPEVASDIMVTGAKIFYSDVGAALPVDTVAAGGDWGVDWTYLGYTLESLKLTYHFDVLEIMVQQSMSSINRTRMKEDATFETVLAEYTSGNLALALAGTTTATAAGSGQPGKEEFDVGGDYNLPIKQWGIEGSYVDEDGALFPVRAFMYKGTAAEGGTFEWDREKPAGIPLQIRALADTSKAVGKQLLKIQRILEPAT